MSIAITHKTADLTATNPTSPMTTGSVAYANGKLYIACISLGGTVGTGIDCTGITGGGLTWVKIKATAANAQRQASMWCGFSNSSATTGNLSVSFAGTVSRGKWSIEELTGTLGTAGNNGSDAFIQSVVQESTSGQTSFSVALATFADAVNNVGFGFGLHAGAIQMFVKTGYTLLVSHFSSSPAFITEYKLTRDSPVTASWTGTDATMAIAAEIGADMGSSGGGGDVDVIGAMPV